MMKSTETGPGGAPHRYLAFAMAVSTCFASAACGTSADRAAVIARAAAQMDLANVPDSQLCSERVPATPIIQAERQVRGLADCVQYRKDSEEDAKSNMEMILVTRGFGAPLLLFAIAKSRQISSRECPYMAVRPFGTTTKDCPRYAATQEPTVPGSTPAR
jgi:hypothetical protein